MAKKAIISYLLTILVLVILVASVIIPVVNDAINASNTPALLKTILNIIPIVLSAILIVFIYPFGKW